MMRRRSNAAGTVEVGDKNEELDFGEKEAMRPQKVGIFWSDKRVFLLCLIFRVVNSLLVQTYFNPDEHWQALEVAHRLTFGYGHLTWEWNKGLRSYLHPVMFAMLYKFLDLCHLDTPWFMARAPRMFQSLFCAVGDLYLYKFSYVLFGHQVSRWALFSQLTNWFMFFCFPRTLSNSLETVFTIVSLFYWPCMREIHAEAPSVSRKWGLTTAAFACAIRPTSAITWLYVGLLELFVARDRLKFIFLETIPIGALVLSLTFFIDRFMYGSWVLVPLNFLRFNFLSSGGDYYGTHIWHWYFTQGFSVMVFTFLPFSVAGIVKSKNWKLSGLIAWVLGLYSILGHKEFRFVLPVLPVALLFSGYSLATLEGFSSVKRKAGPSKTNRKSTLKLKLSVILLLVTNIPMALYMSLLHQRGTEDALNYLSREATDGKVNSILFLMPCHATPYYSTLHSNTTMQFLDCTPSEDRGVLDESDRFLADPVGFTSQLFQNLPLPSHIVLFESEEKQMLDFLKSHLFIEIKRFFHAHFKVDRDLQASVAVYKLTEPGPHGSNRDVL